MDGTVGAAAPGRAAAVGRRAVRPDILVLGGNAIYRARANSLPLSPDEIRAAAATHHEIGPEYQSAVIESFLDRVGREIDMRVAARIAAARPPAPPPVPAKPATGDRGALALAIVSIVSGIPLTAIATSAGFHPVGMFGVLVIWIAIAVINITYNRRHQPGGQ